MLDRTAQWLIKLNYHVFWIFLVVKSQSLLCLIVKSQVVSWRTHHVHHYFHGSIPIFLVNSPPYLPKKIPTRLDGELRCTGRPWHLLCLHELPPSQAAAGSGKTQRQRRDGGHRLSLKSWRGSCHGHGLPENHLLQ